VVEAGVAVIKQVVMAALVAAQGTQTAQAGVQAQQVKEIAAGMVTTQTTQVAVVVEQVLLE
jgi:hypothetical protein